MDIQSTCLIQNWCFVIRLQNEGNPAPPHVVYVVHRAMLHMLTVLSNSVS